MVTEIEALAVSGDGHTGYVFRVDAGFLYGVFADLTVCKPKLLSVPFRIPGLRSNRAAPDA